MGILAILYYYLNLQIISFSPTIFIGIAVAGFIIINLFKSFWAKTDTNILLFVFITFLTIVVSDLILRQLLSKSLFYRPHEMFGNTMPEFPNLLSRYQKNVDYAGTTFGDLSAMSNKKNFRQNRITTFRTDKLGFRNKPRQKDKENDIILLGDSFGLGSGTLQDSTVTGFLLHDKEVYNLCYPSNPLQALANLYLEIDNINRSKELRVIWLLFTGNDQPMSLPNNSSFYLEQIAKHKLSPVNYFQQQLERVKTFIRRSPIRLMIRNIFVNKSEKVAKKDFFEDRKMLFYKDYIKVSELKPEQIRSQAKFKSFTETLELAKNLSEKENFKLTIVLLPTKYQVYEWIYKETGLSPSHKSSNFGNVLSKICVEIGIEFFDALPFLQEYAISAYQSKNSAIWWLDDTHLNVEGHRGLSIFFKKILSQTISNE